MVVYRRKTTGKPEKYDFLNTLKADPRSEAALQEGCSGKYAMVKKIYRLRSKFDIKETKP